MQFVIGSIFGLRKIPWGAINPFGPHRVIFLPSSCSIDNSIFLTNKASEFELWRLIFYPPLWGAIALLSLYIGAIVKALIIVLVIICIIACLNIPAAIWRCYRDSDTYYANLRKREKAQKEKARLAAKRVKESLKREMELLACELVEKDKIDLKTLPRQTVRLRFLDLKRKVCRPFAKGN